MKDRIPNSPVLVLGGCCKNNYKNCEVVIYIGFVECLDHGEMWEDDHFDEHFTSKNFKKQKIRVIDYFCVNRYTSAQKKIAKLLGLQ